MSITIGLRFYRISVVDRESGDALPFKDADPYPFLTDFVEAHSKFQDHEERQRSWLLDTKNGADDREIWGYARYGTFGFTSDLVDRKTRKPLYTRQDSDLEEIPLFFHIWTPPDGNFGLMSLQSFQGRSCIQLILSAMSERFKEQNPNKYLRTTKVSPNFLEDNATAKAPVKRVTLISKTPPADKADLLIKGAEIEEFNYEVSISAKRNGSFGLLGDFSKRLGKQRDALLMFDDHQFDRAVAEISLNGRRRRVGLAGIDADTGAIDVTEEVDLVKGHPTFTSICTQSNSLMVDIHAKMSKK